MEKKESYTTLEDGMGARITVRTELVPKYMRAREEVLEDLKKAGAYTPKMDWFLYRIVREETLEKK